jgi:transposase
MQYVGIDWAYRRARWWAISEHGEFTAEATMPADEDGLLRLVARLGPDVKACVEMMLGAVWVRDRLERGGWQVEVADARKVKALAPLAAKTDKVDARVLATLAFRDLVPALWVPSLSERALKEQLKRRAHLIRLRSSAKNRSFGLLSQWGLRLSLSRLRAPDAMELLESHGVPEAWRRSVSRRWRWSTIWTVAWRRSSASCCRWRGRTDACSCLIRSPAWLRSWGSPSPSRSAKSPAFPRRASWSATRD